MGVVNALKRMMRDWAAPSRDPEHNSQDTPIPNPQEHSVAAGASLELQHPGMPVYERSCLAVWRKNLSFMNDARFRSAYRRGITSGHSYRWPGQSDPDIGIEWNVYNCCWAAQQATRLPGDLVECGVSTGILSLAVCEYIDFNATGKTLWLFDTFCGIPEEQMSEQERAFGRQAYNMWYPDCWERAKANFAAFPKARLVRGVVPDTLADVGIDKVCYLVLDMNIAAPERAAIEFFWPKLVPGAIVVLDDYAWMTHEEQKSVMDEFAAKQGVPILTLSTGQAIMIK